MILGRFIEEVILVKGARTFAFEKIVNRLQRKVHGTVMEIDLGALVHNLNLFRSHIETRNKNHGDGEGIRLWKR